MIKIKGALSYINSKYILLGNQKLKYNIDNFLYIIILSIINNELQ